MRSLVFYHWTSEAIILFPLEYPEDIWVDFFFKYRNRVLLLVIDS